MRREQVFKICLNHILSNSIEYIAKDEKTWLFHAADYSDGEINHEKFCIRFKDSNIAQDFKKAVTDALNNSSSDNSGKILTEIFNINNILLTTATFFVLTMCIVYFKRSNN